MNYRPLKTPVYNCRNHTGEHPVSERLEHAPQIKVEDLKEHVLDACQVFLPELKEALSVYVDQNFEQRFYAWLDGS